jgi:hypothetical protein
VGDNTGTAEYSPASISFDSGSFDSGAQACVNLADEKHPQNLASNHITRYWTVTSSNITSFLADLSFVYIDPADIVGTESAIYTGKYDSGVWTAGNTADTINNILSMDNVSSFSDFTGLDDFDPNSISIFKDTDPTGGTGFSFGGDLGAFSLDDGGSETFNGLTPGDFDVTETPTSGWTLVNVTCTGADYTPITNGVTIHLDAGETVGCTFYNEADQKIFLPIVMNQ